MLQKSEIRCIRFIISPMYITIHAGKHSTPIVVLLQKGGWIATILNFLHLVKPLCEGVFFLLQNTDAKKGKKGPLPQTDARRINKMVNCGWLTDCMGRGRGNSQVNSWRRGYKQAARAMAVAGGRVARMSWESHLTKKISSLQPYNGCFKALPIE